MADSAEPQANSPEIKVEVVRNGLFTSFLKSAESYSTQLVAQSEKFISASQAKFGEVIAPTGGDRNAKMGRGVTGTVIAAASITVLGAESLQDFQKGDKAAGASKLGQIGLITMGAFKSTREAVVEQFAKLPGVKTVAGNIGEKIIELTPSFGEAAAKASKLPVIKQVAEKLAETGLKLSPRMAGKAVPVLGAVVEECYGLYGLGKGLWEGDPKRGIGNFVVAQGGAIGALVPYPGASFIASEALSEGASRLYNHFFYKDRPEGEQIRGATTVTLYHGIMDIIHTAKTEPPTQNCPDIKPSEKTEFRNAPVELPESPDLCKSINLNDDLSKKLKISLGNYDPNNVDTIKFPASEVQNIKPATPQFR